MTDLATNVLYYCVDLVYLDPPFNSNRDYNVIFRDESGNATDAQLLAFDDTWHWGTSLEARGRVGRSLTIRPSWRDDRGERPDASCAWRRTL